eukprot:757477-Rhodomonas_salina.8
MRMSSSCYLSDSRAQCLDSGLAQPLSAVLQWDGSRFGPMLALPPGTVPEDRSASIYAVVDSGFGCNADVFGIHFMAATLTCVVAVCTTMSFRSGCRPALRSSGSTWSSQVSQLSADFRVDSDPVLRCGYGGTRSFGGDAPLLGTNLLSFCLRACFELTFSTDVQY